MMKATVVVLFCFMAIASSAPALKRRWVAKRVFAVKQSADDSSEVDASSPCFLNPCQNGGSCFDLRGVDVNDAETADVQVDSADIEEVDGVADAETGDVVDSADIEDVDGVADAETGDVVDSADIEDVDGVADAETGDVVDSADIEEVDGVVDAETGDVADVEVDDDSDDDDDDDIDYVCVCPAGFFGAHCEEEIDEDAVAAELDTDSN